MFNADDKITVPMAPVSNGIDLGRFTNEAAPASLYKKFGVPKDAQIVGYIGRLDAEKHLSVLVQAFKRVSVALPSTHLLVVGDGTDAPHLKQLVKRLGLQKNVTFTGKVSDEDLVLLHRVADVYCMPSPAELQSIATLEAMASGKPIVAVDAGALKELCQHERNGFLCEQDNDEQIAQGITTLLKDDELRAQYASESLAIAQTHDLQTTLHQFEKIYSDLVKA